MDFEQYKNLNPNAMFLDLSILKDMEEETMTPNDLEFLIHCHVCPSVHPRVNSPAIRETISRFVKDDILYYRSELNRLSLTLKGRHWMKMILKTPYPKHQCQWVDPLRNEPIA